MFKQVLKTRQEVEDFVNGLVFFGTGGGGKRKNGVESLMSQVDKGVEVGWVDPAQISDDAYTICPFLMGSIAPKTEEILKEMKQFGLSDPLYEYHDQLASAVTALEKIHNKKVQALVPIELGGANAAACIAASAINGIVTVDGDYTGRAIPEIQQTTPYIFEKSLLPITACDAWGNTSVINNAVNWHMAERIGKHIAAASFSIVGEAGFFLTGKEMKDVLIHGTMTECYEIGKLIREEREAGKDPLEAAVKRLGGWVLLKGKVTDKDWYDRVGYYWGTHTFAGDCGTELKVWFKNENHVSWRNGEYYVTSPDMIIVANSKTGEAYTNDEIEIGQEVTVIGVRAREDFRRPRGVQVLGPRAFGYDIEYKPIEEILG